jgi:hypothetical protein
MSESGVVVAAPHRVTVFARRRRKQNTALYATQRVNEPLALHLSLTSGQVIFHSSPFMLTVKPAYPLCQWKGAIVHAEISRLAPTGCTSYG